MAENVYYATGKRKTSVARVYLSLGAGQIVINGRSMDEYFGAPFQRELVRQPLELTGLSAMYNATVHVHGGGISGQAGAIRHGIARALTRAPAEESPRSALKQAGLLTRDAREVERKKYGQPGARKRYQYSKR